MPSRHRLRFAQTRKLVAQAAASGDEYGARRRLQQLAIRGKHRIAAQREHSAASGTVLVVAARLRRPDRRIQAEL